MTKTLNGLRWWQWGKLLGGLSPLTWLTDSRLCAAVGMHVLCDFTLQADWMAEGKAQGKLLPLAVHSLVAGALPGAVAAGPGGAAIGFLTHLAIDGLGLSGNGALGAALDQALHVAVLCLLVF